MSAAARLAHRHRRRLGVLAVDRCRIFRAGAGRGPWNNEIGDYDPAPDVEVAAGFCSAVIPGTADTLVDVADSPHTLRTLQVQLHHEVDGDVRVDDQLEFTESINRHLLGRVWHVDSVSDGTFAAGRLLAVTEVQRRG